MEELTADQQKELEDFAESCKQMNTTFFRVLNILSENEKDPEALKQRLLSTFSGFLTEHEGQGVPAEILSTFFLNNILRIKVGMSENQINEIIGELVDFNNRLYLESLKYQFKLRAKYENNKEVSKE